MSLFKKLGKIVGKVAKVAQFVPGPIGIAGKVASKVLPVTKVVAAGGLAAAVGRTAVTRAASKLPALPMSPVGRTLPGIGSIAKSAAGTAAGVAVYDAAGNFLGNRKKSRRVNPLNYKALTRALRRVEKAKHLQKRLSNITIRKKEC